jgi:hypothetical protein
MPAAARLQWSSLTVPWSSLKEDDVVQAESSESVQRRQGGI